MSDDSIPDLSTPATDDDLRWWLNKAPTLRWTFAKSMPNNPHWWVRGGRTPGFTVADAWRVGRVIRTFGEPGKFYRRTQIYLFTDDRARKFWMMFEVPLKPEVHRLVNLAHTDKVYGPQDDFDESWLAEVRMGGSDD